MQASAMQPLALTHRSRRGCLACRRRHLKCDEQQPACSRCYCKNETCDYGTRLIWPDESRAKGVRHGRGARIFSSGSATTTFNGVSRATLGKSSLHGAHFLNTSIADMEEYGYLTPECSDGTVAQRRHTQFLQHRVLTPILQYDEALISFYGRILCGNATVEDSAKGNPFRAVLIPLALQSSPVLKALQAVSAKVIALHQPDYRDAALSYHTDALGGLVGSIGNLEKANAGLFEACVLCILLCWFEICCDTNGRWLSHLTGLLHLLGHRGGTVAMPPFIVDYFVYHFVVARTVSNLEHMERAIKSYVSLSTCRTRRLSQEQDTPDGPSRAPGVRSFLSSEDASVITRVLLQWMGTVDLHEINTYPGLSGGLLLLMNQITDLEYVSNKDRIAEHNRKIIMIKSMLENHVQYASKDLNPTTVSQVCASAETYRLGCLLYLHQKVTSIRARIVVRATALTPVFSGPQIFDLVCQLVAQLENKPLARTVANPLWPLFMAGCSTNDEDLRVRILALFSQIESDQRFWNVPRVRMLIEKVWRLYDLCADEPVLPIKKYKKPAQVGKAAEFDGKLLCDWDRVLHLMTDFTWSIT